MNWQPIETAPKDGTQFLVFDKGEIEIVAWVEFHNGRKGFENGDDVYGYQGKPSHWMPLPEPPKP